MLLYNARIGRNSRLGFTLAEISAIVVIVGILAAIGIPNFLGMYQRFQANSAFDKVRGAIQESQLQAIRRSKTCTIRINEAAKTIAVNNAIVDKGCLLEVVNLPNSTEIRTSNKDGNVLFTYQGNTNTLQTIVVFDRSQKHNKCLVISNGIGMMRSGFYADDSLSSPISPDSCNTIQ